MTMYQDGCGPTQTPDDFDIAALREKYRAGARKATAQGRFQAVHRVEDDFAGYYEVDPHTPVTPREPIAEDIDVAVLGGGFGGLLSAAHLKKAGVDDVRIIELGGDFGGVWYWNRYPGIQCDNESYCYIPLLEELDYMPTKKFADGAEIYQHCRNIGKHFGLYDSAHLLHSGPRPALGRGDQALADQHQPRRRYPRPVRGTGVGPLPSAKIARHPGIKTFGGHSFHSVAVGLRLHRWRHHRGHGQARRQAGRGGRHRRDRRSRACPSWRARPSISTSSSAPRHRRRAQQHPNRSRMGQDATSRAGNERQRNFHSWTFEGMALGQPDLSATSGPSSAATPRPG